MCRMLGCVSARSDDSCLRVLKYPFKGHDFIVESTVVPLEHSTCAYIECS